MNITMKAETMSELLAMGYILSNDGTLKLECGSISNYKKVKIYQPILDDTLDGNKEMFCLVEYERFEECGYREIDGEIKSRCYVKEPNLISYLKGIKGIVF